MPEYKTLEEYLQRDPLNDYDFTREIRNGFAAKGISFNSMSWSEANIVVEAAIKPLRDEIARLRAATATGEATDARG